MSDLPVLLKSEIEKYLSQFSLKQLEKGASELSENYRAQSLKIQTTFLRDKIHYAAYLALRMPATFAAISQALTSIPAEINSLLDLGSGPATGLWAAIGRFPHLKKALLIEQDPQMIEMGTTLLKEISTSYAYLKQSLTDFSSKESYDLTLAAYSLSELSSDALGPLLRKLWENTNKFLLVVESGTPYGFKTVLKVREILLGQGAHIVAPCPHLGPCPLAIDPEKKWCHFSVRLQRPHWQQRVKGGSLGYEDEKFSYILLGKESALLPEGRILDVPDIHKGHLKLSLCTPEGLEKRTISKRDGELYKKSKKLKWGDSF